MSSTERTFLVTRHPGAVEWAERRNLHVDAQMAHLDPRILEAGDRVIGTLPVHLAADVCSRGARYLHLALDMSPQTRGRELSADALEVCNARLEEYWVQHIRSADVFD